MYRSLFSKDNLCNQIQLDNHEKQADEIGQIKLDYTASSTLVSVLFTYTQKNNEVLSQMNSFSVKDKSS